MSVNNLTQEADLTVSDISNEDLLQNTQAIVVLEENASTQPLT